MSVTASPWFLHGGVIQQRLLKPSSLTLPATSISKQIRATKTMQGRVVCSTSDKTVSVEVTRLAPHPKYKRRVRKIKKYQAHDPDNTFQVGDIVQLEKIRPISKTKTFLAVPAPPRNVRPNTTNDGDIDLGIPFQTDSPDSLSHLSPS